MERVSHPGRTQLYAPLKAPRPYPQEASHIVRRPCVRPRLATTILLNKRREGWEARRKDLNVDINTSWADPYDKEKSERPCAKGNPWLPLAKELLLPAVQDPRFVRGLEDGERRQRA